MLEAIQKKLIIDIDMFPNWNHIYCGICLLMNDEIIVMLNFNEDVGSFDGYTILKNKDLSKFRYWESQEYAQLKNDNKEELINAINTEHYSNLITALSHLSHELISIFTYDNTESYFVGQIEKINPKSVQLKLINEGSEWIVSKKIKLDKISYIGFRTSYEFGIMN